MTAEPVRGVGRSVLWSAICKDCIRSGETGSFDYPEEWRENVQEVGGSVSDRCPDCRRRHAEAIRSVAVPYVDIETVSAVADPLNPSGPLGALGPLPVPHSQSAVTTDLGTFEFGLTDNDACQVIEALTRKRVVIVVAGTGSGKSTFLPYRLLYPPDGAALHLGRRGLIVVTEPRQEATKSTAEMVATLLCKSDSPGAGSPVGYKMRGDNKLDPSNRLIFVTDGTLIHWLGDGTLDRLSVVMIDEAHELNPNIEIILTFLAANLDRYPHLRVVIASATINPAPFVRQFGGPDVVEVLQFGSPSKNIGYGHPLWPDIEIDPASPEWLHDHWEGVDHDCRPLVEVTAEMLKLRLPDAPASGRDFRGWRDAMPGRAMEQVTRLLTGTSTGDIIVFLHGKQAIEEVGKSLQEWLGQNNRPDVKVLQFMAETSAKEKLKVKADAKTNMRRVILATNIAETSLTLDGLRYVVDTGLINRTQWDPVTASQRVVPTGHSQFGIQQRWGRVGRKAPGWVFPLYSRDEFAKLRESTPPEATRSGLSDFYLRLKSLGVDDVASLPFLSNDQDLSGKESAESFDTELARSGKSLVARGALGDNGLLTERGREQLRTSDPLGAAVMLADRLTCAVEVATAVALLGNRGVVGGLVHFDHKWSPEIRLAAARHHRSLAAGCVDDLELALGVFWEWERIEVRDRAEWCKDQWIDPAFMAIADAARVGLLTPLRGKTREAAVTVRGIELGLLPRVRYIFGATLADLRVRRVESRWVDAEDRAVMLEGAAVLPEHATSAVSLTRQQRGGEIRCASLVLIGEPMEQIDEFELLAHSPPVDLPAAERDVASRRQLAEVRRAVPVGTVLRGVATGGAGEDHVVVEAPRPPARADAAERGDIVTPEQVPSDDEPGDSEGSDA